MTQDFSFGFDNEFTEQYYEFLDSRDYLGKDVIGENHHIFPKSIFGNNNITIRLTYQDHFRAHWFLAKMYEQQGMKREYMQMAKAFFMFIGTPEYRKEIIRDYTEEDIMSLAELVAEAREHNRLSSVGELNPMYGKTQSPETRMRIKEAKAKLDLSWSNDHRRKCELAIQNRQDDDKNKYCYFNPVTNKNIQLSFNDITIGNVPDGFISGHYISDHDRLRYSLRAQEVSLTLSYDWILHGENHPCFNTRKIYNPISGERTNIPKESILPDGFVYGTNMSIDHKEKLTANGKAKRGVKRPDVTLLHTGIKRSDDTRNNMKLAKKTFFENGGETPNKNSRRYLNLTTRRFEYINQESIEKANSDINLYCGKLFRLRNIEDNSVIYIADFEEIPYGYKRGR